jgi:hypothetical protein
MVESTQNTWSYEYQLKFWKEKGFDIDYANRIAKYMSQVYGKVGKESLEDQRTFCATQNFSYALDSEVFPRFLTRLEMAISIMDGKADDMLF